ncbi:MAG: ribokinase [Spirochaetaceae bacterium]|jgi:ribokinase|nr:ribokinase [Spirochaetaceae bacterium]
MEKSIVILGSINYDIVSAVERLPLKGETVHSYGFDVFTGGKGANQAAQIALLGMRSVFVGQVGGDAQGENVLAGIRAKGVDASFARVSPGEKTGCALITVAPDGSNTLAHAPGANHRIPKDLVDSAAGSIRQAEIFITQNEINQDALSYGLALAREGGVRTLLNPAPAIPLPDVIFAMLDYIAPNEVESEIYTGISRQGKSPEAWRRENAEWFLERGVGNVCLTLGAEGAYFFNGKEERYVPAFPITAVDTTAAGDSFIGGFAFGIAGGWPVEKCLVFANACGAVSAETKGAQNSIGDYKRISAFLEDRDAGGF